MNIRLPVAVVSTRNEKVMWSVGFFRRRGRVSSQIAGVISCAINLRLLPRHEIVSEVLQGQQRSKSNPGGLLVQSW